MKRGILVDVAKLTVREVQFNGLKDMYRLIDCDMVECVSYGKDLDVWVDEEGLLKNDGKGFFMLPSYPQPFKGNGLLTGGVDENGETVSCTMSLEDAAKLITFGVGA
jgi:hypothetical protein